MTEITKPSVSITRRRHWAYSTARAAARTTAKYGSQLYTALERDELPGAAVMASLGCGNPIAVAELHEGERVLDLGSGGGIDVLLSGKRVGPAGRAFGLRYDRRDAGPWRNGTPPSRRHERRVPQGPHRGDPLPAASIDVASATAW